MINVPTGEFYLGKTYDLETGALGDEPVLYEADDLTTHAVCIGMTGSGKTGLGIGLLEEAALQGLPLLIVDPKGDMANLLLTFPELQGMDFEPWVDPGKAQRDGLTTAEYAGKMADRWRKGLGEWGQSPERIQRLRESAAFTVYTPGSDAGQPVSVVQSFVAPRGDWETIDEDAREQISGLVSALLNLVDIQADPLRSREHILLSNIIEHHWRQGEDLDLMSLIQAVQNPPFRKLGVFDLDAFFPPDGRFELAMVLNGLVAAPSFQEWMTGSPLDIPQFLHTPEGRPRVSIFYLAHLSDAERMFFVTLLLQAVRTWLRGESGSSSLRAILYFDELFGYMPPHPLNPPSKEPLLALLKQARAYGLGLMLTTQNPVDLDYKGLTNAGTWFIGKLQTARDKARLMEGLESVTAEAGGSLSSQYLDKLISSLRSRTFLLHNVHAGQPRVFMTRWVMSYLRGPLTRDEVRRLQMPVPAVEASDGLAAAAPAEPVAAPEASAAVWHGLSTSPPTLPPDIPQYYLASNQTLDAALIRWESEQRQRIELQDSTLVYRPGLAGLADVHLEDTTKGIDHRLSVSRVSLGGLALADVWASAESWTVTEKDLRTRPVDQATYEPVPEAFNEPQELKRQQGAFVSHLYHNLRVEVPYNPKLKVYGQVGESERDFRRRCEERAREGREEDLDKVRAGFERQRERLEQKLQREKRELFEDEAEHDARKREELFSAGESVISFILGRRSSTAISKASRRRRYTEKAKQDVLESEETIEMLQEDLEELQREEEAALDEVRATWADILEQAEPVKVRILKRNIQPRLFGLLWIPHWAISFRSTSGTVDQLLLPAYEGAAG
jgi:hypothetical protein